MRCLVELEELGQCDFFHKVIKVALNSRIDLFAVLNENGILSVHRFNGKSIWYISVASSNASFRWSSDGKYLLLNVNGESQVYSHENGVKPSHIQSDGLIDCSDDLYNGINFQIVKKDSGLLFLTDIKGQRLVELQQSNERSTTEMVVAMHKNFILVNSSENQANLIRLKVKDSFETTLQVDEDKIHTMMKEVENLSDCYEAIVRKLVTFGSEKLMKLYTQCDQTLFEELVGITNSIGLRLEESKYHTTHGNISGILQSLYNNSMLQTCSERLRKLLEGNQSNWDQLILWLRSVQTAGISRTAVNVKEWQSNCSSTKISKILEIIENEPFPRVEMERLVEMAKESITLLPKLEVEAKVLASIITRSQCIDFINEPSKVTVLSHDSIHTIDLDNGQSREYSIIPGSYLVNDRLTVCCDGSLIKAQDFISNQVTTIIDGEQYSITSIQVSHLRKTLLVLQEGTNHTTSSGSRITIYSTSNLKDIN